MLCQFSVKNYKSFQYQATLDFQATNIKEHQESIIVDLNSDEKYLPLAAIYGPNGSGKSNLLDALYGLISKLMRPICAACGKKDCSSLLKSNHKIVPFKFNPLSNKQPTEFEMFFKTKKAEYKYNLSVKDDIIIYESLYMQSFDKKKVTELFIRDYNSNEVINLNKSIFKGINITGITESLPLLSYLSITNNDIEVIKDILQWIENRLEIINFGNPYNESRVLIPKSEKRKQLFLQMIREMDIDIEDYRVEDDKKDYFEIYTKHTNNNFETELELREESSGTIKLFGLLPQIADSISNGTILVVDELDSKLHPKLLEYIIELYRNPNKNKSGAQLIFTSHDLMTMKPDLLRRDEIWFVAKNNEQSSQLYSLVEFKKENGNTPRKDEKYGKQYLEGRYGADPYLRRMINWEEQNEPQRI